MSLEALNSLPKGSKIEIKSHRMPFRRPGTTSRGTLTQRTAFFLSLSHPDFEKAGLGEASPLPGLSLDTWTESGNFPLGFLEAWEASDLETVNRHLDCQPALKMGVEMAVLNLIAQQEHHWFPSPFQSGEGILINGLVWMGGIQDMEKQAESLLNEGFKALKFKVGALDFDAECALLKRLRSRYSDEELEIRLDANGAFHPKEAMGKLDRLAEFDIHSIEQPVKASETKVLAALSLLSPIPIALDESLIGVAEKGALLDQIKPAYLILKPTLLGGFSVADDWIKEAASRNIGWWATSALEANPGLAAIAQWVSAQGVTQRQGLGTGRMFDQNPPPLMNVRAEHLWWTHEVHSGFRSSIER